MRSTDFTEISSRYELDSLIQKSAADKLINLLDIRRDDEVSSGEVRVYPLQGLDAKPYPHMEELVLRMRSEEIQAEIVPTPFEFQRGANRMMILKC